MTGNQWGRVGDDGTVFVKTAEGEREVGQYPDGTPEEALKIYTDRYDALALEVDLLVQRIHSETLAPDEAQAKVKAHRESVSKAKAVGDLTALAAKLDELNVVIATQRQQRKVRKAEALDKAKSAKDRIAGEAEKIAKGKDWRNGAQKLRDLMDEWKTHPRISKREDDELWKRFSTARTAYTKARKAHFAEMDERRDEAARVKREIIKKAETLATSREWGPTSGEFRDLMRRWKAAGPAPRAIEEDLWQEFRATQDQFFSARDEANAELDKEFAANAEVKEGLLVEAEALLPIKNLDATKEKFRAIAAKWDEAGKVPRDRMKELEGRMRTVEQSIRELEDEKWKATDPEKSARADDMITKLEGAIADIEADLAKARTAGNEKKVKELEENLASRRSFLDMAKQASADYS